MSLDAFPPRKSSLDQSDSSDNLEATLENAVNAYTEIAKAIGAEVGLRKFDARDPLVKTMNSADQRLYRGAVAAIETYGDVRIFRGNGVKAAEVRKEITKSLYGAENWPNNLRASISKETQGDATETIRQLGMLEDRLKLVYSTMDKYGFTPDERREERKLAA